MDNNAGTVRSMNAVKPTLILFDIDGTLIDSRGAGRDAMAAAGRSVFGESFRFDDVEFAGQLDPAILAEAAVAARHDVTPQQQRAFEERYLEELRKRLRRPPSPFTLPGVRELLERLDRVAVQGALRGGLLTGNARAAATLKLEAVGIERHRFTINAFGDEARTRPDLVALARDRHRRSVGDDVPPDRTVVIGDTPRDVAAAKAHGCVALAVATGSYDADALAAAGADRVVASLEDPAAFDSLPVT